MASLVDVFVQNKTTTLDVPTSTSKDEGVKEAPSLFDSLFSFLLLLKLKWLKATLIIRQKNFFL